MVAGHPCSELHAKFSSPQLTAQRNGGASKPPNMVDRKHIPGGQRTPCRQREKHSSGTFFFLQEGCAFVMRGMRFVGVMVVVLAAALAQGSLTARAAEPAAQGSLPRGRAATWRRARALALRGGADEEGGREGLSEGASNLRQVQQKTWQELRERGYVDVCVDPEEWVESDGACDGIPLEPLAKEPAAALEPARNSGKVLYIVKLCSNYNMALIFQKFCQQPALDAESISARLAAILRPRHARKEPAAGGAAAAPALSCAEDASAEAPPDTAPPAPEGGAVPVGARGASLATEAPGKHSKYSKY
jgi:hypothetical protein